MSRIARAPVKIPSGVTVDIDGQSILVKGPKGELQHKAHDLVEVAAEDSVLRCRPRRDAPEAVAQAATTRALVNNMVTGVSQGFERRLELSGIGYRAQAKGNVLNVTLGYSHPIDFSVPQDVTVETPSQTEIVVKGTDKQRVGQVAAMIRGLRPPEPYKGKGVRYVGEALVHKEAKKK